MQDDLFKLMLAKQLELQTQKMKDGDPRNLRGEARADFIRWNAYALEDEIHEATAEVKWKPWAKDPGQLPDIMAADQELVDAFHFFMNLLLVGNPGLPPEDLADLFFDLYMEKNAVNAKRQDDGYTGDKCPVCKREVEAATKLGDDPATHTTYYKCPCGNRYHIQKDPT